MADEKSLLAQYLGPVIGLFGTVLTLGSGGVLYTARAIPRLDGRIDTLAAKQEMTSEWLERVEKKLDKALGL